jgi:hypothetical protein
MPRHAKELRTAGNARVLILAPTLPAGRAAYRCGGTRLVKVCPSPTFSLFSFSLFFFSLLKNLKRKVPDLIESWFFQQH